MALFVVFIRRRFRRRKSAADSSELRFASFVFSICKYRSLVSFPSVLLVFARNMGMHLFYVGPRSEYGKNKRFE